LVNATTGNPPTINAASGAQPAGRPSVSDAASRANARGEAYPPAEGRAMTRFATSLSALTLAPRQALPARLSETYNRFGKINDAPAARRRPGQPAPHLPRLAAATHRLGLTND
jgi:hypothetical protein